ncbi:MAG: putative ABC transporter permease [Spirochaetaceae bacterium]|nr:putative ABC transporter permease [Spirochaetaceae bacterium]
MPNSFSLLVLAFAFFSLLAWVVNTLTAFFTNQPTHRFLYGPYQPLYGLVTIIFMLVTTALSNNLLSLMALALIFFIGYYLFLQRIFKTKIITNTVITAVIYGLIVALFIFYGRSSFYRNTALVNAHLLHLLASLFIIVLLSDIYLSLKAYVSHKHGPAAPNVTLKAKLKAGYRNFSDYLIKLKSREHTAFTLNGYKLFWIFMICGVLGTIIETLFVWLVHGVLESRQGVIYGPFNQVYGVGGVLMVVILLPLMHKRDTTIFIASALLGGGFEWLISFAQQNLLHSESWQYTGGLGALGSGRTSWLYMLYWGVLGLVFLKFIAPHFFKILNHLLKRRHHYFTLIIMVVMLFNLTVSALAVYRFGQRSAGITPHNSLERFIDTHYNDQMLKEIYPSLHTVTNP